MIKKDMVAERARPKKVGVDEDWESIDAEEAADAEYVFI